MTTRKILTSSVLALAALAAGNAFADSSYPSPVVAPAQSSVTRAQVAAELAQARQSAQWSAINDHSRYPVTVSAGPVANPADVRAALNQARQNGTLDSDHS